MLPDLFHIPFLHTYGLLVALAFLAALWITGRLARRAGLDPEAVLNLGIYCALAGIAGAKLMMFLVDVPYYLEHPGEIFSLSTLQAGGVFYGGLIAALITAFVYMRKNAAAAAADGGCVRAGHRAGPRHRAAGLLFGGLLLGRSHAPAMGRDIHQSRSQPAGGSAARNFATSHSVLRGVSRSSSSSWFFTARSAARTRKADHQPVPDAVLGRALRGGVRAFP